MLTERERLGYRGQVWLQTWQTSLAGKLLRTVESCGQVWEVRGPSEGGV